MYYKGYSIERDKSGWAPKSLVYGFTIFEDDLMIGWGETIEECKRQIDKLTIKK